MRRNRGGVAGEQRRRNFCTRVEVAELTLPPGFMVCGEWESEKLSCRREQEENEKRTKFQQRQRSNLNTL